MMFRTILVSGALMVGAAAAADPVFVGPVEAGQLAAPPRLETSGFAASQRDPGILWTHDDSGGAASLYAVKTTGELVGELRIDGTINVDWEDLASFVRDGKAWLLIADTGDNTAQRGTVLLHIVAEPAIAGFATKHKLHVSPARTLRVRYEDGPRDCEGVAVDPAEGAIYLLSKRDDVKRLYRVELEPKNTGQVLVAQRVGLVEYLPQATAAQRGIKGYLGRRRAEATAMDFTADGTAALVLTYGDLLLFVRRGREPWASTLSRPPIALPGHGLIQAEAACFSTDGNHIYVAAEGSRELLRYDRK